MTKESVRRRQKKDFIQKGNALLFKSRMDEDEGGWIDAWILVVSSDCYYVVVLDC